MASEGLVLFRSHSRALQRSKSPADARLGWPGPPTHAIASARAHAFTMATVRAATVTPQSLQRLVFTEKEDQPWAAQRAEDEARVAAYFTFRCRCHAALPRVLLAPFPSLRASSL